MARQDIESLVLQMSADIRKMEKGLNQAKAITDKQTKAIEDRFQRMNRNIVRSSDQMSDDLRRSIAAIGLTAAVTEVTRYADAWTTASNKLAAAGIPLDRLAAVQTRLVDLALQTRTGLSETINLYARLTRSTEQLGTTQEQVFRATEILNKAFKAGGAATSEQASAIMQLGQALGSGMLQGDELRSLRENAPLLAQAIADEFDTTIAGLKELGAEGKLTTDRVFNGILAAGASIEAQFAVTKSTVADAFTNLQTAATQYFGSVDANLGVTEKFVGLIDQVAGNLDLFANAAVAAVAVLGTRGLAGAMTASRDGAKGLLADLVKSYRETSALRTRAAIDAAKELRVAESILDTEQGRLSVAKARATIAREAVYTAIAGNADEAKAVAALRAAQVSNLADLERGVVGTGRAWDRYRDAIDNVARTSADHKRQMDVLIAAESDYNRTLIRQQTALANVERGTAHAMATSARAAPVTRALAGAFAGLNTFLASPIGTIALIAALTFGLSAFGAASETAADKLNKVETALDRMKKAQGEVEAASTQLEAVNERIEELVREQGEAARSTADIEIAAINARIAKNKELAGLYRDQALAELAEARAHQAREDAGQRSTASRLALGAPVGPQFQALQNAIREANAINAAGGSASSGATPVDWDKLIASATEEARLAARAGKATTEAQRELLRIAGERGALQARIDSLQRIIDGEGTVEEGGVTGGGGNGDPASKLRAYTTALEDFQATVTEIRASTEGAAIQSRAAVQALLDYARAGGDVAKAFEEIPSLVDVLTAGDDGLVRARLTEMAIEAAEGLATGGAAVLNEFTKTEAEILRAITAAEAAGLSGLVSQLMEDLTRARIKFAEDMAALTEVDSPYDIQALADFQQAGIYGNDGQPLEFVEEFSELREGIRSGVREGLREGIRTDDWGQALRNGIAEAITGGMNKALDRFADALTDILTGQNPIANDIFAAVAGSFGFGAPRAAGGGAGARSAYRVNDRANGEEFLFMGSNPGQVLRAADINGMLSGMRGGGMTINAPFTVQGSIDAVTWPMVKQAFEHNTRKIVGMIPAGVNATLRDNKIQKRRV